MPTSNAGDSGPPVPPYARSCIDASCVARPGAGQTAPEWRTWLDTSGRVRSVGVPPGRHGLRRTATSAPRPAAQTVAALGGSASGELKCATEAKCRGRTVGILVPPATSTARSLHPWPALTPARPPLADARSRPWSHCCNCQHLEESGQISPCMPQMRATIPRFPRTHAAARGGRPHEWGPMQAAHARWRPRRPARANGRTSSQPTITCDTFD